MPRNAILFLVGAAAYFATAGWLKLSYIDPIPSGHVVISLTGPYEQFGFASVKHELPGFESYADDVPNFLEAPSPLLLYEDGKPLGPSRSNFKNIKEKGAGRFGYMLKYGFSFSTSDNTDPNKNGRHYWVVLP